MVETLQQYEKLGWSWHIGYNIDYGGYYAQAWRDRKKYIVIDNKKSYCECITEGGVNTEEALGKLIDRLENISHA